MQAFKLVVCGDGAVGKTCLLMCFTQEMFPREYIPTVFDNYSKNYDFSGRLVRLDLYDTAGQEDYDRLRVICYPNTDVFLVCFSVESEASLNNVKSRWVPELRHHAPEAKIVLVGLKSDLRNDEGLKIKMENENAQFVSKSSCLDTVEELELQGYVECSALKMKNINKVFEKAIEVALGKQKKAKGFCTLL